MTPEEQARDFAERCGQHLGHRTGFRRVCEDDLVRAFVAYREAVIAELRALPFGKFGHALMLEFPAQDTPDFAERLEAWRDAAHSLIDLTASQAKPTQPAVPAST